MNRLLFRWFLWTRGNHFTYNEFFGYCIYFVEMFTRSWGWASDYNYHIRYITSSLYPFNVKETPHEVIRIPAHLQLNNSKIVDQNTFIFRNLLHFFIYHIALTRTCQEINFRIYLTKSNTVLSFFLFCFFSYQIIRHSFHLLFFLCILKNKKSNPRCYICLVSC